MREDIQRVLKFEPVRVVVAFVLAGLAVASLAGLAVPVWLVAIGAVLSGELARAAVVPVEGANKRIQDAYTMGTLMGASWGETEDPDDD